MSTTTSDRQLVTVLIVVLGALVLLPVLFMGFGMMGYGPMMGGTWGGGMWGGGMWGSGGAPGWMVLVGLGVQVLFLALLAGAGYLLYRAVAGTTGEDAALAELRQAYARGDLTDDEYDRRKDRLERD